MKMSRKLSALTLSTVLLFSQTPLSAMAEEQLPAAVPAAEIVPVPETAVVLTEAEAVPVPETAVVEPEFAIASAAEEPASVPEPEAAPAQEESVAPAEPEIIQEAVEADPAPEAENTPKTEEPAPAPEAEGTPETEEPALAPEAEGTPKTEEPAPAPETEGTPETAVGAAKADTVAEMQNASQAVKPVAEPAASPVRKTRFAVLSDIHYVADQLRSEQGEGILADASKTEYRLMAEIDTILSAALNEASETVPDVLLVCGDLLSNGELLGARALADKLKAAKQKEGLSNTGFYVVNGNHDINNSYAADFTEESIQAAQRIQPEDFSEIFSGLGYGENDHYNGGTHSVYTPANDNPDEMANHGGLSYAATVAEGIRLIVLDTGTYRTDEDEISRYNEAQQTGGYVSDDLLAWAANEARQASSQGDLVLVMSHHGLLPHYDLDLEDKGSWYMSNTNIPNWEKVADTLADAGVTAVFTGHSHANDIAKHISKNNNVLYDIESSALCAYPCAWRTIDIETIGEGADRTYTFSIRSKDIRVDPSEADTSNWTFTIGGETKSYETDYNGNLQDYAYDKTGINQGLIEYAALYNIKYMLYDIVRHDDGIAGYLHEKLELPEDQTLGQWAHTRIVNMVDENLSDLTKSFSLFGTEIELNLKNNKEKSTADRPQLDVTLKANGITETGRLFLNLDYIATAVNTVIATVQNSLEEGDWMKDNYASAPLLDDVQTLLTESLIPALSEPLDEDDSESSAFHILNDGFQAFNRGDEGLADSETVEKREHGRELLTGDTFANILSKNLWSSILKVSDKYQYPAFSQLMQQPVVKEETPGILTLEQDSPYSAYLGLLQMFGSLKTFSDILSAANMLSTTADFNPLSKNMLNPVIDRMAGLHEVMTNDHNVPTDNNWGFHAVRFDANGGEVTQKQGLTVEDMKLVSLPSPEAREDYEFDGWFTEPSGGRQITLEDDMTGINTLYAHWTYIEKPVPETPITPTPVPEPTITPAPAPEAPETAVTPTPAPKPTTAPKQAVTNSSVKQPDLYESFGYTRKTYEEAAEKQTEEEDYHEFCAEVAEKIQNGETQIELESRKMLCPEVVKAIESCETDLFLVYKENDKGIKIRIPALSDLQGYQNEDGTVYVFRLAEEFGYEWVI